MSDEDFKAQIEHLKGQVAAQRIAFISQLLTQAATSFTFDAHAFAREKAELWKVLVSGAGEPTENTFLEGMHFEVEKMTTLLTGLAEPVAVGVKEAANKANNAKK